MSVLAVMVIPVEGGQRVVGRAWGDICWAEWAYVQLPPTDFLPCRHAEASSLLNEFQKWLSRFLMAEHV